MAVDPDVQDLLDEINRRLEALEGGGGNVFVPPDTIVQNFPDGTSITYRKD